MKAGNIEVICGPMFAGKTEELIRRANRLKYANKSYLVFKPSIDDRYTMKDEIVSHNFNTCKAVIVNGSKEILTKMTQYYDAIFVDEAQFFDIGIINVIKQISLSGTRVIVGGLDCDFRGEPFGPMPQLLAIADSVTKLSAICVICGDNATLTSRVIDGKPANYKDNQIMIGTKETYEPRCRIHHEINKKKP